MLRLHIPDVLKAFVTIDNKDEAESLVIESIQCFGPRELVHTHVSVLLARELNKDMQKDPHLQSDFGVFQLLTQELAKTIHLHPGIALQQFMVRRLRDSKLTFPNRPFPLFRIFSCHIVACFLIPVPSVNAFSQRRLKLLQSFGFGLLQLRTLRLELRLSSTGHK